MITTAVGMNDSLRYGVDSGTEICSVSVHNRMSFSTQVCEVILTTLPTGALKGPWPYHGWPWLNKF